jgi:hypothetical protein
MAGALPHPSPAQVAARMRTESIRVLYGGRSGALCSGCFHYVPLGNPVTIPDGRGGALTAVAAVVERSDGTTGNVFFWHDRRFLQLASDRGTDRAIKIISPRPAVLLVQFAHYGPNDDPCCPTLPPARVTYVWTGRALASTGTPSYTQYAWVGA